MPDADEDFQDARCLMRCDANAWPPPDRYY
jgi:hypothetical protein